jgi:hypothetical protein
MSLTVAEKEKLSVLIAEYIKTDLLIWSEEDRNKFRQWYFELFLESFGQSRRCWVNAINKLNKEINRVP